MRRYLRHTMSDLELIRLYSSPRPDRLPRVLALNGLPILPTPAFVLADARAATTTRRRPGTSLGVACGRIGGASRAPLRTRPLKAYYCPAARSPLRRQVPPEPGPIFFKGSGAPRNLPSSPPGRGPN